VIARSVLKALGLEIDIDKPWSFKMVAQASQNAGFEGVKP